METLALIKFLLITLFYGLLCLLGGGIKWLFIKRRGKPRTQSHRILAWLDSQEEDLILKGFESLKHIAPENWPGVKSIGTRCERLLEHPSVPISIEAGNLLVRIGWTDSIGALEKHIQGIEKKLHEGFKKS